MTGDQDQVGRAPQPQREGAVVGDGQAEEPPDLAAVDLGALGADPDLAQVDAGRHQHAPAQALDPGQVQQQLAVLVAGDQADLRAP